MSKKNVFQLTIGGNRTTKEVMAAGKYDWLSHFVNGQDFPIRKGFGHGKIEIIDFSCETTSQIALLEARRRGLERPHYEDALFFGEQFPEEQRERPILFLHEPWQSLDRRLRILALGGSPEERWLTMRLSGLCVHPACGFAFACK